jgi:two-component system C4-dicarboxylate transport response regulator DctD
MYVLLGEACGYDTGQVTGSRAAQPAMTLSEQLERSEHNLIEPQLKASSVSIEDTSVALGLPRKTLYDEMKIRARPDGLQRVGPSTGGR